MPQQSKPSSPKTSPDRELCLEILDAIFSGGAYSTLEVDDALDDDGAGRPSTHAGFVTEVVFGVLRRLRTLDWLIERIALRPLSKISATVLDILRVTLYQVLYMDSVPLPIAANEAVLLARKHANEGAAGFVNGCLRGLSRRIPLIDTADVRVGPQSWGAGSSLPAKAMVALSALGLTDSMASGLAQLGLIESMPDWMIDSWCGQYGEAETRLLCAAFNRAKDVSVRTNALRTSRDELMRLLEGDGVRCKAGCLAPEAIHCRNFKSIGDSRAYREGLLQVQDEGATAVTRILDPQPGETVMDVCAAPGGKLPTARS